MAQRRVPDDFDLDQPADRGIPFHIVASLCLLIVLLVSSLIGNVILYATGAYNLDECQTERAALQEERDALRQGLAKYDDEKQELVGQLLDCEEQLSDKADGSSSAGEEVPSDGEGTPTLDRLEVLEANLRAAQAEIARKEATIDRLQRHPALLEPGELHDVIRSVESMTVRAVLDDEARDQGLSEGMVAEHVKEFGRRQGLRFSDESDHLLIAYVSVVGPEVSGGGGTVALISLTLTTQWRIPGTDRSWLAEVFSVGSATGSRPNRFVSATSQEIERLVEEFAGHYHPDMEGHAPDPSE